MLARLVVLYVAFVALSVVVVVLTPLSLALQAVGFVGKGAPWTAK